jgi:hypothetical protein
MFIRGTWFYGPVFYFTGGLSYDHRLVLEGWVHHLALVFRLKTSLLGSNDLLVDFLCLPSGEHTKSY